MSPCTHIWSAVSFMDSSWSSIFHFLQGYGKQLPRGFHLSNCHISKASQGEWICWGLPKTHTSSSSISISLFFFFMTSIFQDLSCEKKQEKKQEVKRSSAVTGYVAQPSVEQHLTLCSYFASFKPFHAVSLSLGLHQTLCEFNVLTLWTRKPFQKLQI